MTKKITWRECPNPACQHPPGTHFKDITGTVRCLVVESGESTSGVLGIPYTRRCLCVNFDMTTGEES